MVAKLQFSKERPDERSQECAFDAERSRGNGPKRVEARSFIRTSELNDAPNDIWIERGATSPAIARGELAGGARVDNARPYSILCN
jgi:hypothetical protein